MHIFDILIQSMKYVKRDKDKVQYLRLNTKYMYSKKYNMQGDWVIAQYRWFVKTSHHSTGHVTGCKLLGFNRGFVHHASLTPGAWLMYSTECKVQSSRLWWRWWIDDKMIKWACNPLALQTTIYLFGVLQFQVANIRYKKYDMNIKWFKLVENVIPNQQTKCTIPLY